MVIAAPPLIALEGPAQSTDGSKKAPAKGSEKKSEAGGEKSNDKAVSKAQKMLDAGVAAYEAGKTKQAVRAFDTAIRGSGLDNRQMARALYYRGLAYRKKGKPGLAIPDLTSAIWLKDGLSVPEKQEAIANRAAAYRDAGVADVPQGPQPAGIAGTSLGADGWQTAMTGSGTPPSSPTPPPAPVSSPPPAASAPVSAPQTAAYAPARPPPPQPQATSSSGGISGFFNSIFGGGSSSSNEVTTSSVAEAPAASNWSQTTEVVTPGPTPQTAAAPPPPPLQPAPERRSAPPAAPFATQTQVAAVAPPTRSQPQASETPSGKYHVQVAAVRSRDEAYALSGRLMSQHGSELGARRPEVDQTVIGSMGTFYRVKVGPYASIEESQRLCGSLRTSGFDCLVITQ